MNDPVSSRAEVFLDTGYLIALEDADDANHSSARPHRKTLIPMPRLTTPSYVVDEVVTFFNVRGQHGKAVELGEMLLPSPSAGLNPHIQGEWTWRAWEIDRNRGTKQTALIAILI